MSTPKRDTRLLGIILALLCLLFVSTYAGRLARKTALEQEILRQEAKIEQSKEHQRALVAELRYIRSDAYVEKLAYDEFGMIRPNEEPVVMVPVIEADVPVVEPEDSFPSLPLWRQWLARFGFSP